MDERIGFYVGEENILTSWAQQSLYCNDCLAIDSAANFLDITFMLACGDGSSSSTSGGTGRPSRRASGSSSFSSYQRDVCLRI